MIIDHETMTEMRPNDETLALRVPRRMDGKFAGPFPVRRVTGLSLRRFAETAPIEDVVEVVKALSDDTATHALPAVEKLTGEPSSVPIAHRTARRIQETFTAAGWNIAVWYGEHTKEFWVMDENGLRSFADVTSLYQGMGWLEIPGEGIVQF